MQLKALDHRMAGNFFCYYVHGFSLHSEIECPELLPGKNEGAKGNPDVRVCLGSLAHIPWDETRSEKGRRIGDRHMLINMEGVARYSVREGREVIVDPALGADEKMVRLYLLGSVLGCIIHQRGLLPLHANAFLHDGEAVLVLAHSGMGKSTLAAAMYKRGRSIFSDDVCAVEAIAGRQPVVYPGVPHIKLWQDAAEQLGENVGRMQRVIHRHEKYAMPILAQYCTQSAPIKALYILNAGDWRELNIVEPGRLEMIAALKNYTYRRKMVSRLGNEAAHLEACATLEKAVRVRRILRPRHGFLLNELADLLERDLQ